MSRKNHVYPSDLRSVNRLATAAIVGITDLVEAMHHNIARPALRRLPAGEARTDGIAGLVYRSVRGVTRLAGSGVDAVLGGLVPAGRRGRPSAEREAAIAALNGVMGDYLAATGSDLAIEMELRLEGRTLPPGRAAIETRLSAPGSRVLILVHGLCMNDLQWRREGQDHGAALARDLGYTPVYLRYNSGLHISENGRLFAQRLEQLALDWPLPMATFAIVGHSMGGLVARSAWHYGTAAGHTWPALLRHMVFLGTPHHGAPLERGGNWIDIVLGMSRYTVPFARLGKLRSAGITDLRHGYLVDEDWRGRDRFARSGAHRRALPLPANVRCQAIAVTTGKEVGGLGDRLLGDGLVPVASALGRHPEAERDLGFAPEAQWTGRDMNHLDLLSSPEVYRQIRNWLERP